MCLGLLHFRLPQLTPSGFTSDLVIFGYQRFSEEHFDRLRKVLLRLPRADLGIGLPTFKLSHRRR